MTWTDVSEVVEFLSQPPYLYICGAALVLAFLFLLLRRRQPSSVVAFTSEGGRVMVTRSAITELVHTSCNQLRDVAKPSIRIRVKRGQTNLEVRLKLASGGRLTEVAATLKEHLKAALQQNLGIDNLGSIDITVTGFKSGKIAPRPEPAAPYSGAVDDFEEAEEEPEAFRTDK